MSQIHIHAQASDIAPYVLLPGDPNRSRMIAETFLDNARCYTSHRGLLGFTGTYKGMAVTVQTTGMGCASAAIVTEEVIRLGAQVLVRVGTCGAASPALRATDLVIAQASVPNDGTTRQYLKGDAYAPVSSYAVLEQQVAVARSMNIRHHIGLVSSEDAFYASTPADAEIMASRGILAVEMEASAIFLVAAMRKVQAGCLLVASNQIGDDSLVDADQLKAGVHRMIEVALEGMLLHAQATQPA